MKKVRVFTFKKYLNEKSLTDTSDFRKGALKGASWRNWGIQIFWGKKPGTTWYYPQNAMMFACRRQLAPQAGRCDITFYLHLHSGKLSSQQVHLNWLLDWKKHWLISWPHPRLIFVSVGTSLFQHFHTCLF